MGVKYGLFSAQLALALQRPGPGRGAGAAGGTAGAARVHRAGRTNSPMSELVRIITAADPEVRNRSLDAFCRGATQAQLLAECAALDAFRRASDNLYERVRALFFLYAIHRFHLPQHARLAAEALDPVRGLRQPAAAAASRRRSTSSCMPRPRTAPERRHCQRAGRGLPQPRLPDPGRPGAAQRALGARQPVDVPHRPSGRPAAARPPGTAATRAAARRPVSHPARSARRCAWT